MKLILFTPILETRKRIFFFIGILLFLACHISCKKYLDEKSNKQLVTPSKIEDFQALLDDVSIMNMQGPDFAETSADDYFLLESDYNGSLDILARSAYTWETFDYNWPNEWSKTYAAIYNSNVCLEGIEKVHKSSQNQLEWNNVKGSALFYRAYSFLNLMWAFAKGYDIVTAQTDHGVVLRLGSDYNVPSVRSSVQASYERIIADAKEATNYLADNPEHVMRPSKAAAFGLLARAYLSMNNYDSAYKYSDMCLAIKNTLMNYNTDISNINANVPFPVYNKEILFYNQVHGNFYCTSPDIAKIDTILFTSYHVNDLRLAAFFRNSNGYKRFKGSYAANIRIHFTGLATDEIYLIRSESAARKGMLAEAMADLNTLLKTRWKKDVTYSEIAASNKDEAIEHILLERRKELLMRGTRFNDIKRLNVIGANIVIKRKVGNKEFIMSPNDSRYARPLPKDIILQTGMPQN
jgi:hypothetical protein